MERTFTLEEAQILLPVLQSLLERAIKGKEEVQGFEEEFERFSSRIFLNGGTLVDIPAYQARKRERDRALQRVKDAVAEIDSIGVQVKDIDIGLLDFPCNVEGEIILLCWKMGEDKITHWHGLEEGFQGRKPIDDRISRARRDPD